MQSALYSAAGHRRSPVTMPGFHEGRAPRNKGQRYPADPPTVEEIIAVMRTAGSGAEGDRMRALIVILWRAGLRIGEALDLAESDLEASRGAVLVRRGKGGRRPEVGMDRWAWSQLEPWMAVRRQLPVGSLFSVIRGATAGRRWEASSARKQLARTAASAGVRQRVRSGFWRRRAWHCPGAALSGPDATVRSRERAGLDRTTGTSVWSRMRSAPPQRSRPRLPRHRVPRAR